MAAQAGCPEFLTQANSLNDFKVRIAIDFGTDGIGV